VDEEPGAKDWMILGRAVAAVARFMRHSRGNAMIQFALAGPVFLLLVFMILEDGIVLFTQSTLDNATRDAARLVLTGQATSASAFTNKLCAGVGGFIPCASLQYSVKTYPSFPAIYPLTTDSGGNMSPSTSWDANLAGSKYVLVQVAYNRKYWVPWLGKIIGGNKSALLVSTYAFATEPY